ncbi:hypothetical protein [Rhizohabitans arisaemae]|uniref:hypothetical protein n=1 Tax=Rhizohabitans arisaemae TaxID=2720610 RepID=UPI0024B0DA03|nr:hypothetical protein [Rhizohabitans arisaemae]
MFRRALAAAAGVALAGLAALTVTAPPAQAAALDTYETVISPNYLADYCYTLYPGVGNTPGANIGFYTGSLSCYYRHWNGTWFYWGSGTPSTACQYYAVPGYTVYSIFQGPSQSMGCRYQN